MSFVRRRGSRAAAAKRKAATVAALRASCRAWKATTEAAGIPYDANRVVGDAVVCWARIAVDEPLLALDSAHEAWVHNALNPLPSVTLNPVDAAIAAKDSSCIPVLFSSLPTLQIPALSETEPGNGSPAC